MYRVSKQFEFPAGHVLSKHQGRCRFPHGHNYKVEITLTAEKLDQNDMVCDFDALKALVSEYLETLDHSIMLNSSDTENRKQQEKNPRRIIFENHDPTTEIIAEKIFKHLQSALTDSNKYKINPSVKLEKVKVWESSSAYAEYFE